MAPLRLQLLLDPTCSERLLLMYFPYFSTIYPMPFKSLKSSPICLAGHCSKLIFTHNLLRWHLFEVECLVRNVCASTSQPPEARLSACGLADCSDSPKETQESIRESGPQSHHER